MNRLYVVESTPTNTGANADHRLPLSRRRGRAPSRARSRRNSGSRRQCGGSAPRARQSWLGRLVKDLQSARGAALVIAGEDQPPAVHALAHAMNAALGNVGTTVLYTRPSSRARSTSARRSPKLVGDMNAGTVELLLVLGGNPVYTAPADLKFAEALDKVPAARAPRASLTTRPPSCATGTCPKRTTSRPGATCGPSTAPSRSFSR